MQRIGGLSGWALMGVQGAGSRKLGGSGSAQMWSAEVPTGMASGMGQVRGCPCPQTGCPPLSFTAESWGARQSWAAALQEAVTETLSDYEVAEKIWSNRANRHCADCGASRPDWAAVNLGVVICKQCAGESWSL